ncbi:Gfo/Idh/MocA family oxidoreductase [Companilactobacillus zhachilii]|uniref:Gfo/Idh/MocA family protein n=1 Tax=Companilactobacillus zhachilii TaxID=2304606 RepID=UPI001921BBB0|nr:Gfo/Idh/MocA family oxidoreductase [Companilactobacillus zhachilii]MBL3529885.1 Gfo/Idh/MocA family oxidoreductase [Companilactobacillus zhachilii]
MKLAIIGSGMIVHDFLTITKDLKNTELTAIIGTKRSLDTLQELKAQYQIGAVYTDFETALLDSDFDTVYVAVPNFLHYGFAKKALENGKNVISEKPFTVKYSEFLDLKRIALEKRLILLEAITNQYLQNYLDLKEKLPELGDLKLIESNYSQYSSRYDAFEAGKVLPAFDPKKGGGALMDINIYNVHFIVGLLGRPQSVQYLPNIEREIDTSGILMLDYGNSKAVAIGAKDSASPVGKTVLQGNKGTIVVNGPTNVMSSFDVYDKDKNLLEKVDHNIYPHRMYQEFVEFEQIIQKNDLVEVAQRLQHSEDVMWVIDQALKSADLQLG